MYPQFTLRHRNCWIITHCDWQGKPLYEAATIWRHNPAYIWVSHQYFDNPYDAMLDLNSNMANGLA